QLISGSSSIKGIFSLNNSSMVLHRGFQLYLSFGEVRIAFCIPGGDYLNSSLSLSANVVGLTLNFLRRGLNRPLEPIKIFPRFVFLSPFPITIPYFVGA